MINSIQRSTQKHWQTNDIDAWSKALKTFKQSINLSREGYINSNQNQNHNENHYYFLNIHIS